MRTLLGDQAELSLTVSEQHEIFAEQAHPFGPTVPEFGGGPDGLPVAAHQVAHWRSRSNSR
jgi:hypothetical protein